MDSQSITSAYGHTGKADRGCCCTSEGVARVYVVDLEVWHFVDGQAHFGGIRYSTLQAEAPRSQIWDTHSPRPPSGC